MMFNRMFDYPTRWNPFGELETMRRQMDRILGAWEGGASGGAGVFPLLNITEDADKYKIRAELPGVKSDELEITAAGKSISISGERKIPSEGENVKYHRREREAGKFNRIINLPREVDSEKVEARLTDGILTVTLPKSEAAKPRQITIK